RLEGSQDIALRPLAAKLTSEGERLFPYLRASGIITLTLPARADAQNPLAYLTRVVSPTMTTPLLTTAQEQVIAATTTHADGRESLILAAPNHPNILHSMLLSYGLINWVTRGVFVGERHANLNIQVDDLLAQGAVWDTATQTTTSGLVYRMTG